MRRQQELLAAHFQKLGGKVEFQRFRVKHPVDGSSVPMANIIVRWHPDRKERICLCGHYDTLPLPMRDPVDHRGRSWAPTTTAAAWPCSWSWPATCPTCPRSTAWISCSSTAKSSSSTRATASFLARSISRGSTWTTRRRIATVGACCWTWWVPAVAPVRGEQQHVVAGYPAAGRTNLGHRRAAGRGSSSPAEKVQVQDDHLPLHDLGGIPTCDLIDVDYMERGPWHTRGDTADKCSPLSLAKVG